MKNNRDDPAGGPVELSVGHLNAVSRRRSIIVEHDAFDPHQLIGSDFKEWLAFRFDYIDEKGSQIYSLWWDFATSDYSSPYASQFVPLAENLVGSRDYGILPHRDCVNISLKFYGSWPKDTSSG